MTTDTDTDPECDRLDRLLTFIGGAAFGVALAFVAVWVAS